jgi:hypothetical protein
MIYSFRILGSHSCSYEEYCVMEYNVGATCLHAGYLLGLF